MSIQVWQKTGLKKQTLVGLIQSRNRDVALVQSREGNKKNKGCSGLCYLTTWLCVTAGPRPQCETLILAIFRTGCQMDEFEYAIQQNTNKAFIKSVFPPTLFTLLSKPIYCEEQNIILATFLGRMQMALFVFYTTFPNQDPWLHTWQWRQSLAYLQPVWFALLICLNCGISLSTV